MNAFLTTECEMEVTNHGWTLPSFRSIAGFHT